MVKSVAAVTGAIARWGAIAAVDAYRAIISPVIVAAMGPACRYQPTCSEYAREAVAKYGLGRGGLMAIGRIMRCRPAGGWGDDPVPPRLSDTDNWM
jgi:putative membrane protein insertion efficiency factor